MKKVIIGLVFVLMAGVSFSQCYTGRVFVNNACSTTSSPDAYEYTNTRGFAVTGSVLLVNDGNDLVVYDVSVPSVPVKQKQIHIPWDWATISGDGTHGPLIGHIGSIATLDSFQYVAVSLGSYGWDLVVLSGAGSMFLHHGYNPGSFKMSNPIGPLALIRSGAFVYLVGARLDGKATTGLRIYPIDPATTTVATLGAGFAVPGATGNYNTLKTFSSGGRTYLVAYSNAVGLSLVADVTIPSAPVRIGTSTAVKSLGFAIDSTGTLWTSSGTTLKGYVFNPVYADPYLLAYNIPVPFTPNGVSTAGNLLVAWSRALTAYVSLPTTVIPPDGVPYTSLDPGRSGNPSTCKNNSFSEQIISEAAFLVSGHAYVARALYVDADIVSVSDTCLSGSPMPTPTIPGPTVTPTAVVPSPTAPGPTMTPTVLPVGTCPPCPCQTPKPTATVKPTTPPAAQYCHFMNGTCKSVDQLPGGMTCPGVVNAVPCS